MTACILIMVYFQKLLQQTMGQLSLSKLLSASRDTEAETSGLAHRTRVLRPLFCLLHEGSNVLWLASHTACLHAPTFQAMHDFRDNAATFLLATPAASRGLDLPAVSHVYILGCPDVTTYLHEAGRAGRIGSPVQGKPTC